MAAEMEIGSVASSTPMRSLERALDVLEVLQRSGEPMRLSDVARAAGLTPATTSRILGVLASRGYVASEGRTHRLGPAVLRSAVPLDAARAGEVHRLLPRPRPA